MASLHLGIPWRDPQQLVDVLGQHESVALEPTCFVDKASVPTDTADELVLQQKWDLQHKP